MKGRTFLAGSALVALIVAGCGRSGSSSTTSASSTAAASASASKKCDASVAVEGPFTGPVAQVGLEQLHFAQLAVANDNAANHTSVTLAQDDTQLTPSIAVSKTQSIIASPAVAVIGPSGSQEVEAVGPLLAKAGVGGRVRIGDAAGADQQRCEAEQQGKKTILFGTDGTNSPSQFNIPGTYISTFGPDISTSTNPLDKSVVAGVAKYGPYGAFGVPTYAAADAVMRAISSVCKAGQTPSRANVLAAMRTTNIPASENVLSLPISFTAIGNLSGQPGYLFHVNSQGKYIEIPPK